MPGNRIPLIVPHDQLIQAIENNDESRVNEIIADQLKIIKKNSVLVSKIYPHRDQVFLDFLDPQHIQAKSPIFLAVQQGNQEIVKTLLSFTDISGKSVIKQDSLRKALLLAFKNNDIKNAIALAKSYEPYLASDNKLMLLEAYNFAIAGEWELTAAVLQKYLKNPRTNTEDSEVRGMLLSILETASMQQQWKMIPKIINKLDSKNVDAFSIDDQSKIYQARWHATAQSYDAQDILTKFGDSLGIHRHYKLDTTAPHIHMLKRAPNSFLISAAQNGKIAELDYVLKNELWPLL